MYLVSSQMHSKKWTQELRQNGDQGWSWGPAGPEEDPVQAEAQGWD